MQGCDMLVKVGFTSDPEALEVLLSQSDGYDALKSRKPPFKNPTFLNRLLSFDTSTKAKQSAGSAEGSEVHWS